MGTDTIYTDFGTDLYDQVGSPMVGESLLAVRAEVRRVVENYAAYQGRQINDAKAKGADYLAANWKPGDIITDIVSIDIKAVADTVYVTVKLRVANGEIVTVEQTSEGL